MAWIPLLASPPTRRVKRAGHMRSGDEPTTPEPPQGPAKHLHAAAAPLARAPKSEVHPDAYASMAAARAAGVEEGSYIVGGGGGGGGDSSGISGSGTSGGVDAAAPRPSPVRIRGSGGASGGGVGGSPARNPQRRSHDPAPQPPSSSSSGPAVPSCLKRALATGAALCGRKGIAVLLFASLLSNVVSSSLSAPSKKKRGGS